MPTADDFIAAAWQATPAFGLAPDNIELLSHSENVVCDMTMPDGTHLVMRLHRPGYNTLAQLRSEVEWVAALGLAGVPVPSALPALSGEHYTSIAIGDEARYVGVVEWVDGEPLGSPLEADGSGVVAHYGDTGAIAAQIRNHASVWAPPADFTRRRWDAEGFVGDNPLWGRFWEVEELSREQRSLFANARSRLQTLLGSLSIGPDRFGLIHADLHLGNLMANNGHLTVIDFDDAGFGWYAYELAVALHPVLDEPWEDDARTALLAGYRNEHPLGAEEEALIDVFLTMRCLMILGWLDARRELPIFEHFTALTAQATAAAQRLVDY